MLAFVNQLTIGMTFKSVMTLLKQFNIKPVILYTPSKDGYGYITIGDYYSDEGLFNLYFDGQHCLDEIGRWC